MSTLTDLAGCVSTSRVIDIARVACSAQSPDKKEGPLAAALADVLSHPRLDVHIDPVLPGRPNLIVRLPGTGKGPSLLLNGHLDASFFPDAYWSRDPYNAWIDGSRLYGGGISDMLGGIASMVATLDAAAQLDPLPGDLVLLANMYHDSNGLGTKYAVASDDNLPRYAINGEPTSSTILTAHGGCIKFEVKFRGQAAHVSRIDEGVDALAAAASVYTKLRTFNFTHQPHPRLSGLPVMVIGEMQAGQAPAQVPDQAVLRGDLRTVPGMSWPSVRADIESVVKETCPEGVVASVGCVVRQKPFLGPTSGALFESLRAAHREIYGAEPRVDVDTAARRFVTDAVDLAAGGIESIVYGPGDWHYRPDEFIEIEEMANAARVYLRAAVELMKTC